MSNQPPQIIHYSAPAPLSKLALAAFILSLFSFFTCFTLIIPLIALFFGLYALRSMDKSPRVLAGRAFADHAAKIGFGSLLLGIVCLAFMPHLHRPRELSNRSYCAANLRGIVHSMNIYAADNADAFPTVPYAPYSPSLNNPVADAHPPGTLPAQPALYASPPAQPGSPLASLWLLVLNAQVSPKQFPCKSDNFIGSPAAPITSGTNYLDNFSGGNQLSYSIAYPWYSDGTIGPWWKAINDSSLPLMADIAPEQSTGTPPRILNPSSTPTNNKTWNSANHNGDGQNVAFSDGHAEWVRRPDIGQSSDNIYSTSGIPSTGPTQFNGIPTGKFAPKIPPTQKSPPYDIMLLPIRNATTGGM